MTKGGNIMKSVEQYEAEQAEWEMYVEAMEEPCKVCGKKVKGACWGGRCFNCHEEMARPYESGEEYIGIRS
jgi:hypothetical protein